MLTKALIAALGIFTNTLALAAPQIALTPKFVKSDIGYNTLEIGVTNASNPKNVVVKVVASMPAMGTMPYMESQAEVKRKSDAVFEAEYELTMGGTWDLTITVIDGEAQTAFRYSVTTGVPGVTNKNQPTTASATMDLPRKNTATEGTPLPIGIARLQQIGVKIGTAKIENLTKTLLAAGSVESDPSKRAEVTLRYSAYVSNSYNHRVGEFVRKGTPLVAVESPEIEAVQNEFLLAGKHGADADAAKQRLLTYGLNASDIAKLKKQNKPMRQIVIEAPIAGTLLEFDARVGAKLVPGQLLTVVGDTSGVFVSAQLSSGDIGFIKRGTKALLAHSSFNDKLQGRVDLIDSTQTGSSGFTRVRIVAPSASAQLSSGQFVDVEFEIPLRAGIVIPQEAILHSGKHAYVFVEKQPGILVATEVSLGASANGKQIVTQGIAENARIAVSGTFLLGSEANLKSALPKWSEP